MSDLEVIQSIRALERESINDMKKINHILAISKYLNSDDVSDQVRLVALHSLRRIYMHVLEDKTILSKGNTTTKQASFKTWFKQQLLTYLDSLKKLMMKMQDNIQEPAIKTIIQFIPRISLINGDEQSLSVDTLSLLLEGLIYNTNALSAEILLMTRDELFSKADCVYHGLSIVKNIIHDIKDDKAGHVQHTENALDVLRIITLPDAIDEEDFLVQHHHDDNNDDDSDKDGDNSDSGAEESSSPKKLMSKGKRSSASTSSSKPMKKAKHASSTSKMMDLSYYKKLYSKAWLALLSLSYNAAQHKIILKHLSDHVIMHLSKPLLLADYLTRSYDMGGIIAVLALESLFHLIIHHNLDYPNFFTSLYKLCKKDIFEAKYRVKYMKLLSQSLSSSNLAAYMVAAFIKRLARLSLVVPSSAAYYCLGQIIWLLRKHPQCQVLIHRLSSPSSSTDGYDANEDNLEKCRALSSSLWEVKLLQHHHIHGISILAKALESPSSTSLGVDGMYLNVADMIDRNYATMMDEELKNLKNRSELAYQQPATLIAPSSHIDASFG